MTATGDRRTHARHDRACCLFTWGPRDGPQPPIARRAAAAPGRASVTVAGAGGPEMAPNPHRSSPPAEPGRASVTVAGAGGPEMAPKPPIARRAPAEPGRASVTVVGAGGPEMAPKPPIARRAPAEPGRASVTV